MACAGGKTKDCIDLDRGVEMRKTKDGVEVYQYIDSPGYYYSAFDKPVKEDLARSAGYPIEDRAKARKLKERLAAAEAAIRKELEIADDEGKHEIIETRGAYKLVDIGLGRFHIEDLEGNSMHAGDLSKEIASRLLDQLVPGNPEG